MTYSEHTTAFGRPTTPADICRWNQMLIELHARIAPHFARPQPRRRTLLYLQGILSTTERKNSWQLAEHAREARPYGMQRLLSSAHWDVDGVRDDVRTYAIEHLGTESAILVIDETSFPKRGDKSAGVGVQYCGTTGQVENCQVGVFLTYVTARGHTLIDRELYLLSEWLEDDQRRHAVGIPETIGFQTKPELAKRMLERVWDAQIPIAWVVADTVYGENLDLRTWLQAHGYAYVLAVPCNEPVGIVTPDGRRRQVQVRDVPSLLLNQHTWQRLSMSDGTKGPRLFDWACVPILHRWQADGQHWLLLRRNVSDPQDLAYYFVFGPPATTLHEMVQAGGARWHIEEDFANTKDMGLDHYQVRSWIGWYRHITLVMLAHVFLIGVCVQTPSSVQPSTQASATLDPCWQRNPTLPLTVPEVRRLLGFLIWPSPRNVTLVLAWSWWRRCHHSWASYYHSQRRLQAQAHARSP